MPKPAAKRPAAKRKKAVVHEDDVLFRWPPVDSWSGTVIVRHKRRKDSFIELVPCVGVIRWRAVGHDVCCIAKGLIGHSADEKERAIPQIEQEWAVAMMVRRWI
jgi:hypothetical protein